MTVVSNPLVSVCIITYNHELFIRQCIEGVLMQKTTFPFEVVIGEDCSADKTRDIITEYEKQYPHLLKVIYHQKNVGGARNAYEFCYPLLKGKYIAICEGDDYWTDPYKLQKQVDFLEENPSYVMCFHDVNLVNQDNEIIVAKEPTGKIKHHNWTDIFHLYIPTLAVVFRHCIQSIPKEIYTASYADAYLKGMLTSYGDAANLGFIGGHYRRHPKGIYSSKTEVDQFKYSLQTRRLMKKSAYFNSRQKKEIGKEFRKRKVSYIGYFIKKTQFINCLKIIFT